MSSKYDLSDKFCSYHSLPIEDLEKEDFDILGCDINEEDCCDCSCCCDIHY